MCTDKACLKYGSGCVHPKNHAPPQLEPHKNLEGSQWQGQAMLYLQNSTAITRMSRHASQHMMHTNDSVMQLAMPRRLSRSAVTSRQHGHQNLDTGPQAATP